MAGPSFQLVMRSGPNQGSVAPLEKSEIHIGRDLGNEIVINDAEVSRRHARMILQSGGYVLEDLGSTNGTSVNGQRLIGPYMLRVGDIISFGEHITVEFEGSPVDPDATIATSVAAASRREVEPEAPPVPVHSFPATSNFSGQVPVGPEKPAVEEPVVDNSRRRRNTIIALVIGIVLLAACACVGILWYIDSNVLWCNLFPFLAGCP